MITIVTDSTADIPRDLVNALNIHIVPAILTIEGKAYRDGIDISRDEFYNLLPGLNPMPVTAAPSSGSIQAVYQKCFDQGAKHIVSLHVSDTLSGIYNAARIAAEQFEGKITLINSGQLSLGLGFQVMAAAEAAASGSSLQDVLNAVENARRRVRVVAMLDSLEYLRRGGRVSLIKARLGDILKVRLFVELYEGRVNFLEQVRTRSKALNRLWELMVSLGQVEKFALLHAGTEADAKYLLDQLAPDLPADHLFVNVTTVIGTHVGPGALGFAALLRN